MTDPRDFVNEPPETTTLSSLDSCVESSDKLSPIDRYFENSRKYIQYGTKERIEENPFLGRLLILAIVSSAESFMRSLFSECLDICPICQKAAGEKTISLSGALWHGSNGFSKSAFENSSFTSRKELEKSAKEFLRFDLKSSIFDVPLDEFEKVCHLRHAIVHNDGFVPGKNAVQLGLKRRDDLSLFFVDFSLLQESAAVVESLVVTINRELFDLMCRRWATDWRKNDEWNDQLANTLFRKIWTIFHSKVEKGGRLGKSKLTMSKCREAVEKKYQIN